MPSFLHLGLLAAQERKSASDILAAASRGAVDELLRLLEASPRSVVNEAQPCPFKEPWWRQAGGCVPLFVAAMNGSKAACEVLISHGASVNNENQKQQTALYMASVLGHAPVVELLLDRGVDRADWLGNTPLFSASMKNRVDVVELLLTRGHADATKPDNRGVTPFGIAKSKNLTAVMAVLDAARARGDQQQQQQQHPPRAQTTAGLAASPAIQHKASTSAKACHLILHGPEALPKPLAGADCATAHSDGCAHCQRAQPQRVQPSTSNATATCDATPAAAPMTPLPCKMPDGSTIASVQDMSSAEREVECEVPSWRRCHFKLATLSPSGAHELRTTHGLPPATKETVSGWITSEAYMELVRQIRSEFGATARESEAARQVAPPLPTAPRTWGQELYTAELRNRTRFMSLLHTFAERYLMPAARHVAFGHAVPLNYSVQYASRKVRHQNEGDLRPADMWHIDYTLRSPHIVRRRTRTPRTVGVASA